MVGRFLVVLLCLFQSTVFALSTESFNQSATEILENFRKTHHVTGAELSISLPGEPLARNYYSGTLSRKDDSPLHVGDLTQIASVTKTFIASLVLRMQEQGYLRLDDTLGTWLPEYPHWKEITIRQLLNHSHGIYNFSDDDGFRHLIFMKPHKKFTRDELIDLAYAKPLLFEPGHGFHYCNTGYLLIGKILEKATSKPIAQLLQENFLGQDHLNLDNTFFISHLLPSALKARMIHGYYQFDEDHGIDITDYSMSWLGAAGGIVSNTYDIVHWARYLFEGQLFSKESAAELRHLISIKTGQPIETVTPQDPDGYGLGVKAAYTGIPEAERVWWHNGGSVGYKTLMIWLPKQHASLVLAYDRVDKGHESNENTPHDSYAQDLIRLILKKLNS